MREIIPLKKDIIFKTKIGEITNISLEHDYKILDDLVEGTVNINGTYKMTEATVLDEEFEYTVPFGIAISKKVNKDTIKIDIDDFKYSISKDVLTANIDLLFTCDEIEEEKKEEKEEEDPLDNYLNDYFKTDIELPEETKTETIEPIINDVDIDNNITNITNTIINNENKYYTYKIYILREGDTVDQVCNKYNISKEELSLYNNLNDLKIGDKILIPEVNE